MKHRQILLSATAAAALFTATTAFGADKTALDDERSFHIATYISGGIGEQSQEALEQKEGVYNLKVVAAYNTGHYLSDVAMMVTDKKGNIVINTVTDGPMLYADLDAGTYNVIAMYDEVVNRKTITIGEKTNLREVIFYWTADGSESLSG